MWKLGSILLILFLMSPVAQGSTASKHCEHRNPDGTFIDIVLASKAWSKARQVGAPDYPKWQRPALIIWHPYRDITERDGKPYQRWGRTYSEIQIDKKGRISLCEYLEIWVPENTEDENYTDLTIEVLAHEYLHLIWIRRNHLELEFKLEQAKNWLDGGELWVRELLGQQDGPIYLH